MKFFLASLGVKRLHELHHYLGQISSDFHEVSIPGYHRYKTFLFNWNQTASANVPEVEPDDAEEKEVKKEEVAKLREAVFSIRTKILNISKSYNLPVKEILHLAVEKHKEEQKQQMQLQAVNNAPPIQLPQVPLPPGSLPDTAPPLIPLTAERQKNMSLLSTAAPPPAQIQAPKASTSQRKSKATTPRRRTAAQKRKAAAAALPENGNSAAAPPPPIVLNGQPVILQPTSPNHLQIQSPLNDSHQTFQVRV